MPSQPNLETEKKKFLEAVKFLKTTKINKNGEQESLNKAHWVLLAGTPSSGKTSLIAKSEIKFNLAKKQEAAEQHQDPNWWVSKEVIYLDIPSSYTNLNNQKQTEQFLKLTKKHSYHKQVSAVVLCVSVKDLLDNNLEKIKTLNAFCQLTQKHLGKQIPFHLVVNQLDLLTGFFEFFQAYAKDERQQPWGFELGNAEKEFDELCQRLNSQVIWRLHHEPDLAKRVLVKDFPLQFKQIKNKLLEFIENIRSANPNLNLKSIHFSSATQTQKASSNTQSTQTQLAVRQTVISKPFFIHDLLTEIIPQDKAIKTIKNRKQFVYTGVLFLVAAIALGTATYFIHENNAYDQASAALSNYQKLLSSPKKQNFNNMLNAVGQLGKADQSLKEAPWQKALPGATTTRQLHNKLQTVYQQAVSTFLIPNITQDLSQLLLDPTTSNPVIIYKALSCYLMLAEPKHFNANYFLQSMKSIWTKTLANNQQAQIILLQQLQHALSNDTLQANINYQAVSSARNYLNEINPSQLSFVILQAQFPQQQMLTLNFRNDPRAQAVFKLKNPRQGLSNLFTPNGFKLVNSGLLSQAVNTTIKGNWVLPGRPSIIRSQLQTKLKEVYLVNYTKHWQDFVSNIVIRKPTSMAEQLHSIALLASKHSPLNQLASLVKANVPSNALAISPELAYLTRFTNPKLINGINHYFENLHNYLLKAKTLAGAYQLTKQRFLNDGASDPINNLLNLAGETSNPIRFWFYQIAQNSWQQLLISTQQFLQNKWGNLVWPTYYNQIVNRYPFSSHSMQYVSLNSFINFFEPSGVLQNYFSRYLRPFINTNKMPWKMLSLNGRSLNINNSILKSFEKLPELQKIFFPNNSSQLNIAFTLTPTQLSDNLANATLTLGNQIAKFAPYNTDAQPLTWPDAKNTQQLSLTFVNDNGVSKTLNFNNAWGLWQLFARSNLKQMTNSDSVKGFIIDGNDGVRFILKPQSKINPFNLKLFSGIQLNQKLAN